MGASNVDSQAITEDAIAAPSDSEIGDSEEQASGFADSRPDAVQDDPASETASPPNPAWQSQRTQKSRQIALVIAVSAAGLLAAGLFFSWFVRTWKAPAETAQVDALVSPSSKPPASDLPADQQVDPAVADPATEPAVASPSQGVPADAGEAKMADADASASGPAVETGVLSPADTPVPSDLLPVSPIAGDPAAKRGGNGIGEKGPGSTTGEREGAMVELPQGLAVFTEILKQNGPIDLAPTMKAPPALDEINIDAAAAEDVDPAVASNTRKRVNLKARLAIQMALDSKGYRLADLVLLFSQLTGVPIQIDWVSFDLIGVDVHQRVQTPDRGKLRSVQELIDAVAESIGAETQSREVALVLTPSDITFDAKLAELTNMDDFGEGRASAVKVLNEFLHGSIVGAPEEAAADATEELGVDDLGQLHVGESREDKQFAILAVESMRRMRGLDPKLPGELLSHWAQTSENQSMQWPLLSGGEAGAQRSQPISIAGLIRRTSGLNQSSCLVQWSDATRRNLSPAQLVLPHVGEDAASMLGKVVVNYGLQVRRVDSNRWWIGAAATYDRAPVVIWTKPLGDKSELFKRRLTSVMTGQDAFRITMDPPSDRAILLLPRYIVRQLPKIDANAAAP